MLVHPTLEEFRAKNADLTREAFVAKFREPFLVLDMKVFKQDPRDFRTLAATSVERPTEMESKDDIGKTVPYVAVLTKSGRNIFHNMITLGRADNNDVVIHQSSVSKFHAFFKKDPSSGAIAVWEAGSRFGSTINGQAMKQGEGMPLASGDTMVFARSVTGTFLMPSDFLDYMKLLRKIKT